MWGSRTRSPAAVEVAGRAASTQPTSMPSSRERAAGGGKPNQCLQRAWERTDRRQAGPCSAGAACSVLSSGWAPFIQWHSPLSPLLCHYLSRELGSDLSLQHTMPRGLCCHSFPETWFCCLVLGCRSVVHSTNSIPSA